MDIDRPLDDIISEEKKKRPVKKGPRKKPEKKDGGRMMIDSKPAGGGRMMIDSKPAGGGIQKRLGSKHSATKKKKSSGLSIGAFKQAAEDAGLTGTRMEVSNLGPMVTEADLKELFSGLGIVDKVKINFDSNHRSAGTAMVIFRNRTDAVTAIKSYNTVPLDGKPLNLSLSSKAVPSKKAEGIRIESNGRQSRKVLFVKEGSTSSKTRKPRKKVWVKKGGDSSMRD